MKLGKTIDMLMGEILLGKILHDLKDWVLNQSLFLFTNSLQLVKNQLWRVYSFEGVPWDNQSNKYHLIKINILHYTVLLSKSKNSLELVSSLHNRAKNQFEKVVIGCTNPWPSFILILRKVLKNNVKCNF